jgi:G3E family GTPase
MTEQIAFADVILLSKSDLVPADELTALEDRIRAINPTAVIHRTERCAIAPTEVLDRRAFDLDRILAIEPDFPGEDAHEHDDAVTSVALRETKPLDVNRFNQWIATWLARRRRGRLCHARLRVEGPLDGLACQAVDACYGRSQLRDRLVVCWLRLARQVSARGRAGDRPIDHPRRRPS